MKHTDFPILDVPVIKIYNPEIRDYKAMTEAAVRFGIFWVHSEALVPTVEACLGPMHEALRRLFELPTEELHQYCLPEANGQTGINIGEKPQPIPTFWTERIAETGHAITPMREADGKYRQMHPFGLPGVVHACPPTETRIEGLTERLEAYGQAVLPIAFAVGEMIALGHGLEPDALVRYWKGATHFVAPTAVPLDKFEQGECVGGAHTDLSAIAIHGQATHPGLYVWTSDGKKWRVGPAPKKRCLLVQIGMPLEHRFAGVHGPGYIAGLHEILCLGGTGVRLSGTVFIEEAYDAPLRVFDQWRTPEALAEYPDTTFGEHIEKVLRAINLHAETRQPF